MPESTTPAAPWNTNKQLVGTLIEWAKLFEPLHQSICKTGAASCYEYDRIWHDYKDKVRPIIMSDNDQAHQTPERNGGGMVSPVVKTSGRKEGRQ